MDHKPLLQERPPAYNLEAGQGDFACGPHGYGAIPAAPPPPPYPYLVTGIPTHHPRVYNIHSRNVTRYPANSIVVVGGCPVCRVGAVSFRRPVASANRGPTAPVIQNLDQGRLEATWSSGLCRTAPGMADGPVEVLRTAPDKAAPPPPWEACLKWRPWDNRRPGRCTAQGGEV
ncbi:membrane protein BRI3 isoform X1 [Diceros bicornis minor]|uniref:membrane protein BRI3 isoform X1 n=1 Tax=Diceros bicornis minor TaxID=77932 RepID=UPI0026F0A704|nr:membrane protein BRI3 isoform X1 [Diceros bicornis minor]